MQEGGHLLTGRDFQRVGDALRRVEGDYNAGGQSGEARGGNSVQVLQIQAGAANSFGYPARIQKWSNSAGTWSDLNTTEVRVESPNGGTLASGFYVVARFLGINAANVGCFVLNGELWSRSTITEVTGAIIPLDDYIDTNIVTISDPGEFILIGEAVVDFGLTGDKNAVQIVFTSTSGMTFHGSQATISQENLEASEGYKTIAIVKHVVASAAGNIGIFIENLSTSNTIHDITIFLTLIRLSSYGFSAVETMTIGTTPVNGSNAGAILYSNGTTLQQVAVTPVGGMVYMGSGAPAITDFAVGALVSQLWQNMR